MRDRKEMVKQADNTTTTPEPKAKWWHYVIGKKFSWKFLIFWILALAAIRVIVGLFAGD